MALHNVAQEVFSSAKAYDKHRPSYPPKAVDALLAKLKVKPGCNVLEVGSGTGKFTEDIARRPEGFNIKAVEPHDDMRGQLAAKNLPGVEVLPGKGDEMPAVENQWADVVIVAQAFHWFSTNEALAELQRVMKPGAMLGMIWNVEDYGKPASWKAATKWEQKMNDFSLSFKDDTPKFKDEKWRHIFDNQSPDVLRFAAPLQADDIKFTVWLTKESIWARLQTLSQIAVLKGEKLEAARKVLDDALAMDDVETNEKGEVAVHGRTYFAWTERL